MVAADLCVALPNVVGQNFLLAPSVPVPVTVPVPFEGPIGLFLDFNPVTLKDLDDIVQIERESFSADEATQEHVFLDRILRCPDHFLVARDVRSKRIVAFISSSRSAASCITSDVMKSHDEGGRRLCIHSVAVRAELRGKGIGAWLLKAYLAYKVPRLSGIQEVALLAHDKVIKMYEKHGFRIIGQAAVDMGQRPWFEMTFQLPKASLSLAA
eukprot:ANDGO_06745.mRNA.1 Polyamine N-acetyltransferase 1